MISYMDNKIKLSAAFFAVGIILSGCGASGDNSSGSESSLKVNKEASHKKQIFTAELGLTPRQRFSKALEKLENGEDGQALAELNAYLVDVPRSNSARNLVAQISTDSSQYFPSEYFSVNLTSGTSLSTLAKRYLGSALKFYALAKYNNIANPSRVNIGQEIKIPLTQLARTQRDKDDSLDVEDVENEDDVVDLALVADGSIADEDAVNDLTDVSDDNVLTDITDITDIDEDMTVPAELLEADIQPQVTEVIPVVPVETAESVLKDLQALIQDKDYLAAIEKVTTLRTFGKFNKVSRELAKTTYIGYAEQVSETDNIQASAYLTDAGKLNLLDEETFKAFDNFKVASDLDVNNDEAMEEMLLLQKEITDKYHREASSAFRRQELDLAIEKWNVVLKVNPDHTSAKLYREQALELKEKLFNINQK